jgi:hypothetical protein
MQLDPGATSDSTWLDDEARAEIYQMLDEYRSDRQGVRYPAFISTRRADGDGYRHHFRALPRNRSLEADAEGRTMLYVYGRRDPSSSDLTLLVAAIIPASAEARAADEHLGSGESRRGPVSLAPQPDTGVWEQDSWHRVPPSARTVNSWSSTPTNVDAGDMSYWRYVQTAEAAEAIGRRRMTAVDPGTPAIPGTRTIPVAVEIRARVMVGAVTDVILP